MQSRAVLLTFSCLKKQSIFSSRNTRLDETKDWNTFGNFLSATRRPSRGSVTALQREREKENIVYNVQQSVLIICTCSWEYKDCFSLYPSLSVFAVRICFKRSLRICLALMSNETKESKRQSRQRIETDRERDRQMANKPNNECRLCCLSRERVQ